MMRSYLGRGRRVTEVPRTTKGASQHDDHGNEDHRKWGTQTWIGKRFGLSAVVVGRILATAGLNQGSEASGKAVLTGHARRCYTADQRPYWMWDMDAVGEVVEEALVHHGGPKLDKLVMQAREDLECAAGQRAGGDDWYADFLEEEAYADIPPGLARAVRRRLAD